MTATLDAIRVAPLSDLEDLHLSIGFADMDGFMKAIQSGSDANVAAVVQTAYDAIGDAIVRNGGRVWKYLGDAIMFSNPSSAAAVKTAHEIAALRFLTGDQQLRFHVSVATGTVVKGTFGHASFRNEDIFGHTIHRAALLSGEAKAQPSHVALDDATRQAIDAN